MCKRNLGLIALSVLVCCLFGCGPTRQIAISPDGKTAAITDHDRMIFRDLVGHKPDRVVEIKDPEYPIAKRSNNRPVLDKPAYAPNGSGVIADWAEGSVIVDPASGNQILVRDIAGPFAWKPDGSEVLGISGSQAKVYHRQSRQVVRSYDIPIAPRSAVWVGNDRDVLFAGNQRTGDQSSELALLHRGQFTSLQTGGQVLWLGYDKVRDKIGWIEVLTKGKDDLNPDILIKQAASDLSDPTVLKRTTPKLLLSSTTAAFPVALTVSPDGQRTACIGLTDASAPGLLDRYMKLSKNYQQNQKELDAVTKRLRFRVVNTVMSLGEGDGKVAVLFRSNPTGLDALGTDMETAWMPDGKAVAMFWNDKVRVQPVNQ